MTADDGLPPITLSAVPVLLRARLLTELDEFLRSGPIIADDLASYLATRGHRHPRFAANNMIDDVSFTADHLRRITSGIDKAAAEYAHLADYFGDGYQQDRRPHIPPGC